jgi:hypothetical protein
LSTGAAKGALQSAAETHKGLMAGNLTAYAAGRLRACRDHEGKRISIQKDINSVQNQNVQQIAQEGTTEASREFALTEAADYDAIILRSYKKIEAELTDSLAPSPEPLRASIIFLLN